jgi:cob(I)alamin adenosyltransferase
VFTRGGDEGRTSTLSGRERKDSAVVEACGTVDELNSFIGLAVAGCSTKAVAAELKQVQSLLFTAGSDLAAGYSERKSPSQVRIKPEDTKWLEDKIDSYLSKTPQLKNFILPGGSGTGARLHLARAVCRRAERRVVTASLSKETNPELLRFFNRLSTYLFDLARFVNLKEGEEEVIWKGRAKAD